MSTFNLYINGNRVADFPQQEAAILFERSRTDYTNPTIVRNAFTKTVKLPGTKSNNQIFDSIWKMDRKQWDTAFNASKRTPFLLMKDGNLVEKGYLKLNNIAWNGDFYDYEVTLYGELGNVLYGLSYSIDPITEEVTPLTLGDLTYNLDDNTEFTGFTIRKELVDAAWKRLAGDSEASGDDYSIFDTINFAVCYDGVPSAKNFDTKKVWVSTARTALVNWMGTNYTSGTFPYTKTENGTTYTTISSAMTYMEAHDDYGLFDMKKDLTPLETKDLRCYLLRPVLRIRKVFEAIGDYLETNMGYSLDLSDAFFATDEFNDAWMTLSMLYEIEPEVESFMRFEKADLMKNTSSPASYLVSYCKIYGMYLDVDYVNKKLVLTRLPNFFNGVSKELMIDKSKGVKVDPLSFDKASYTFDYGDGDGEFYKTYQDTYNFKYGSKRVNTGYRFDASSAQYIDNNVFREAVDALEQSVYYRYMTCIRNSVISYPQELTDSANLPTYKLFQIASNNPTLIEDSVEGVMTPIWGTTARSAGFPVNSGYQFQDTRWTGLQKDVWQDGFPKVQLHGENNKPVDGKDVLVFFNGCRQTQYGYALVDANNNVTYGRYNATGNEYVHYLLSDDCTALKYAIGKNCYYDNPDPDFSSPGGSYLMVIDRLPMFTRSKYDLDYDSTTQVTGGYQYMIEDTLDFGVPREIYVPACSYLSGIGVYNKYWSRYISDMYSVDTRVMDCYCYLDNISGVFREFYTYDNALWILSKITDWDMDTHLCKATFIKVNDRDNYTT